MVGNWRARALQERSLSGVIVSRSMDRRREPRVFRTCGWPRAGRRDVAVVSLVVLVWLVPSQGWAQVLQSFGDLALRVNLDDQLQIEDRSGARVSGRVIHLTRNDLTIQTTAGQKHFMGDSVRAIAARGHRLGRGAVVGAGIFAVLGVVAICAHRGGADCGFVGAFGAAPIGAGVGLAIGALIPQMKPVYRAPEGSISMPPSRAASGCDASLLEGLALRVNLDDRLRVEDRSGLRTTGRLTRLTDDDITIQTDAGGEQHFTRQIVRHVAVYHHPLRTATLVGAGAGVVYGALSECRGGAYADCPDGVIIGGALGAGVGVLAGAVLDRTTIVYPEPEKRTLVLPAISRGAVSLRVSRRW